MSQVITLQPGRDFTPTVRHAVIRKPRKHAQSATGRIDIAMERIAEQLMPPDLWRSQLGELTRALIREHVPSKPFTLTDLAREAGLIERRRRVHR